MNKKFAFLLPLLCVAATNQTLTVSVSMEGQEVWRHTNCVFVGKCPQSTDNTCILVKYVDGGKTNDFHAWLATVKVSTNAPAKKGGAP